MNFTRLFTPIDNLWQCSAMGKACTPGTMSTKGTPACRYHGARHQGHGLMLNAVGDLLDPLEPVQPLHIVGFCCSGEFVEKCLHARELVIYVLDIFTDVRICPNVHAPLNAHGDACAVRERHMHPMCIQR